MSEQIEKNIGTRDDNLLSFLDTCSKYTSAIFQTQRKWFDRLSNVNDVYNNLVDNLSADPELYGGLFAFRCHAAFLAACRLSLAGQIPETYMVLRGCLEAALYGLYLTNNPASQQTWINRHRNDQCRKKVRNEFTIRRLKECLKKTDPEVHARLSEYYDYTIDLGGHPNIWSVESHLDTANNSGPLVLHYLHPISNVLLATFKVCAIVGITGLDIFRYVFPTVYKTLRLNDQLALLKKGL